MRNAILLLTGFAVLSFGAAGTATHDGCIGNVTDVAGQLYVDDRDLTDGGVWVYQENGKAAGYQPGGASVILGQLDVDACVHENSDTLII